MTATAMPNGKHTTDAETWAAHAPELARWSWDRLFNRTDCWGEYRPEAEIGKEITDQDGKVRYKLGAQKTAKGVLTEARVIQHYRATTRAHVLGAHTASKENTSKGGGLDIDYHGEGSTAPEINLRAALAWHDALVRKGFHPLLTDSDGKGGYHQRLLLAEAIPADRVFWFLKQLTANHASLGFQNRPEQFPKQSDVRRCSKGFGNWLRLPGRHHKRDHWSRVWDGGRWLEGAAAVDFILALAGDPASLIPEDIEWQFRVGEYMATLPTGMCEGSGRDDVAFGFLAFLVRDLELPDDYALEWASRWDCANSPPKGPERLREILANVHAYGQRAYGSGNGDMPRRTRPQASSQEPQKQPGTADTYQIDALTLRPGRAHRTPSGKVTVPLTVLRGGQAIDHTSLSSASSGRAGVVKLLAAHLGVDPKARPGIATLLGEVLAAAVAQLDRVAGEGLRVLDVVRGEVLAYWKFTHPGDRGGYCSERMDGREVSRQQFLAHTPEELLDAVGVAVDAPVTGGQPARLYAVKTALEVVWAGLSQLDVTAETDQSIEGARRRFRAAVEALWDAPRVSDRVKHGDGDPCIIPGSLKSHVQEEWKATGEGKAATKGWKQIKKPYQAWWRPGVTVDGELVPRVAMRWPLPTQLGVLIPGVDSQETLLQRGRWLGHIDKEKESSVPDRLGGGKTRLAVLSEEISRWVLDDPVSYEVEPVEDVTENPVSHNSKL